MALPSITAADFFGLINISADTFQAADLNAAIPVLRDEVLINLLGPKAYADIDNNVRARWDTFFMGTTWTDNDGHERTLYPNISIVRSLIYARYIPTQAQINTNTGFVENHNENANAVTGANVGGTSVKAQARASMWWRQFTIPFIEKFRVVEQQITAVSEVAGTYTLTVKSAAGEYLEDGDTVEIRGQDFTATNVLTTSFDVVDTPGNTAKFQDKKARWEPFNIICEPTPKIEVAAF